MRFCFALLNSEGGILVINMDYLSTAVVVQRRNKKEEEASPQPPPTPLRKAGTSW